MQNAQRNVTWHQLPPASLALAQRSAWQGATSGTSATSTSLGSCRLKAGEGRKSRGADCRTLTEAQSPKPKARSPSASEHEPGTSGPCPRAPQFEAPNVCTCARLQRWAETLNLVAHNLVLTLIMQSRLFCPCSPFCTEVELVLVGRGPSILAKSKVS